jgi:predicted XRE-type DNA-binding protein
MQALPPRELTMLYSLKVSRVEQDELKELYNVRQSNISYRLDRANYRIKLHKAIFEACSETALRSVLYDLGLPESAVRAVLGVVKTSSQSATASALGVTQGSVRHLYAMAIEKVENAPDSQPYKKEAYELLTLISSNYNHLRSIKIQCRWKWKVGDTNYPSKPKNSNDD